MAPAVATWTNPPVHVNYLIWVHTPKARAEILATPQTIFLTCDPLCHVYVRSKQKWCMDKNSFAHNPDSPQKLGRCGSSHFALIFTKNKNVFQF